MKANSRRRVLISSVAMLLVAIVALGTSTYAWFINTTTAKANNAKITVAAPSGLKIAAVAAGTNAPALDAYSSSIDLTSLAQGSLTPASGNAAADDIKFYSATVDDKKNVSAITESGSYIAIDIYGILSASNPGTDGAEVAKDVQLDSIAQDAVSTPGNVVRCAYYADGAKKAYMNFGSGTRSVNPVKATGSNLTGVKTNDNFVIPATATNYVEATALSAVPCANVTDVEVPAVSYVEDAADATKIGTLYFWVEGQDESCNNANAQTVVGSTGNITLTYVLVD